MDVAIEAAGTPHAATAAIQLARRGGRVVLVGVYKGTVEVDAMDLLLGEREIVTSLSHTVSEDFTAAVSLLEGGRIDVGSLITDRLPLSEVVTGGFDPLISDPAHHLKVLIFPNG